MVDLEPTSIISLCRTVSQILGGNIKHVYLVCVHTTLHYNVHHEGWYVCTLYVTHKVGGSALLYSCDLVYVLLGKSIPSIRPIN